MERITVDTVNDKKVITCDFSDLNEAQGFIKTMNEVSIFINQELDGTVLLLTDMNGCRFDTKIKDALTKFAEANRFKVKLSAVVNASNVGAAIVIAAAKVARRNNIKMFSDKESALRWLTDAPEIYIDA